jgi:hypothetical protein
MVYFKHGETGSPLYKCWDSMKQRCYNILDVNYERYGRRGIKVCDEWRYDYLTFKAWAVTNGYSKKLSLDRIDNDRGYSPDNCRWATMLVQNNNSSFNKHLTINGITQTIAQWTRAPGCVVAPLTVYSRITKLRWPPELAVFAPKHTRYP